MKTPTKSKCGQTPTKAKCDRTPTPRVDARQTLKDIIGDEYVSVDFARKLERELIEARKLAERYRYLSCDSQEEADAEVLPWENNQPTEL